VSAVLGVVVVSASAALATSPGANGKIAFRRYFSPAKTSGALFTMNSDGSNVTQITHPPSKVVDDTPDWAPDGKRLTYFRCPATAACSVWVVNADGTGQRRLTRCGHPETATNIPKDCEDSFAASFAPDSRHVTFRRATGPIKHFKKDDSYWSRNSAIAIEGVDGKGEREIYRLAPYSGDANWPQLSPDGRQIVFERANSPVGKPSLQQALFVLNADGSGVHRVTPWNLHAGDGPDWAPDGSRILFRSNAGIDKLSQYYTVRPDGSALTQLTHFPAGTNTLSASFSPDGHQILFAKGDAKGLGDIWTMNADATNQRVLLHAATGDSAADWGPAP